MNNTLNQLRLDKIKICLATLILLVSLGELAQAQDLQLTAQGCDVTVKAVNGNGCDDNQCGSDESCVCLAKGEHARWLLSGSEFKLKFSSNSPLKANCGKHFKKDKQKCVVKDDAQRGDSYSYLIMLKQCANGSDPKIVIK